MALQEDDQLWEHLQGKSREELRIASQKSSFLRFKHLFSSDAVLVSPPRPHLRSSALEQERNMAYVREKEEDFS